MTKPDHTEGRTLGGTMREALTIFGFALAVTFSLGIVVGFFGEADAKPIGAGGIAIGAVMVLIAGLCGWQLLVRLGRLIRLPSEPMGASQRKVRNIWIFLVGLGLIFGFVAGLMGTLDEAGGFTRAIAGSAPIPTGFAAALLAGLAVLTGATVLYLRYVDEHDRAAQDFASLVSVNLYVVLFLGWNIAARGGLMVPVDHGAIFAIVVLTYCAIWGWKRYF